MIIPTSPIVLGNLIIFFLIFINELSFSNIILMENILSCISIYILMRFFSLTLRSISKKTLLGLGDAKVFSLGGAWLGIEGCLIAISIAFTTAGIFAFMGRTTKILKPWQPFPFAPFICMSIELTWNHAKAF